MKLRALSKPPSMARDISTFSEDCTSCHGTTIPFFQIAEAVNDVILVTTADTDGVGPVIIYANPAFSRLTGYTCAEVIGLSPRLLQGPGTSRATLDSIRAALSAGREVHEKLLNYAKSGAPYWLDVRISPLHDGKGNITHFVAIERDVTLDKRQMDDLEHMADRDTLTGIPNRRALLRRFELEIGTMRACWSPLPNRRGVCMAFIDVDHFKQINDDLGHIIGDAVLFNIADRLMENVRRSDMVGRIGGEEFAVCMPGVTLHEARVLAERLRCCVEEAAFDTPAGPVAATISVGVAAFEKGDTLASLMERADSAMYTSKQFGRNRVTALEGLSSQQSRRSTFIDD
jgi:diguanylate cyclase (GGDEF)-like protein/PAS domain S-box-containing protein